MSPSLLKTFQGLPILPKKNTKSLTLTWDNEQGFPSPTFIPFNRYQICF